MPDRRDVLKILGAGGLAAAIPGVWALTREGGTMPESPTRARPGEQEWPPVEKTEEEWKRILEPERFRILFEEETEPRGASPLLDEKRDGKYICAACFLPLFDSETKFESGTGWPSFYRPLEGRVETKKDFKMVWPRTEYHCARCGGHQGHVFDDGPPPTGKRYCNNGLALRFVPADREPPELRT